MKQVVKAIVKVLALLVLLAILLVLTGCAAPGEAVIELDASGAHNPFVDARVGGCAVYQGKTGPAPGCLQYQGERCQYISARCAD